MGGEKKKKRGAIVYTQVSPLAFSLYVASSSSCWVDVNIYIYIYMVRAHRGVVRQRLALANATIKYGELLASYLASYILTPLF